MEAAGPESAEPEPEPAVKPEGVSSEDDIVYRKGEIAKKGRICLIIIAGYV